MQNHAVQIRGERLAELEAWYVSVPVPYCPCSLVSLPWATLHPVQPATATRDFIYIRTSKYQCPGPLFTCCKEKRAAQTPASAACPRWPFCPPEATTQRQQTSLASYFKSTNFFLGSLNSLLRGRSPALPVQDVPGRATQRRRSSARARISAFLHLLDRGPRALTKTL